MDSFGIVKNQIINEFAVEFIRIQEKKRMVINKFILNCAIESFQMSVHFRGFGISMIMNEVLFSQFSVKMFLEFASVVSQNILKLKSMRKSSLAKFKEFFGSQRGM